MHKKPSHLPPRTLSQTEFFFLSAIVHSEKTFYELIKKGVDIHALVALEEVLSIEPLVPGAGPQMLTALDGFLMSYDYYPRPIRKSSAKIALTMATLLIEAGARGTHHAGFGALGRTLIKENLSPLAFLMMKHFEDAAIQVQSFLESSQGKNSVPEFRAELEKFVLDKNLKRISLPKKETLRL